jgi:hypothetical protein
VVLAERNQEVQALALKAADLSFAKQVSLGRVNRDAEEADAHRSDDRVGPWGVHEVGIAKDKPVIMRRGEDFPARLQGPGGRWLAGDIVGRWLPTSSATKT